MGGYDTVDSKRLWQKVRTELNLPYSTSAGSRLRTIYHFYFLANKNVDVIYGDVPVPSKRSSSPTKKKPATVIQTTVVQVSESSEESSEDEEQQETGGVGQGFPSLQPLQPGETSVFWYDEEACKGFLEQQQVQKQQQQQHLLVGTRPRNVTSTRTSKGSARSHRRPAAASAPPNFKLIKGVRITATALRRAVDRNGGIVNVISQRLWQNVRTQLRVPFTSSAGSQLKKAYLAFFGENSLNKMMGSTSHKSTKNVKSVHGITATTITATRIHRPLSPLLLLLLLLLSAPRRRVVVLLLHRHHQSLL